MYNIDMEPILLRIILSIYIFGAFGLTLAYLHYRHCSTSEILLWGMLALIIPVLGPFFVIAARPGPKKRHSLYIKTSKQSDP